MLITFYTNMSAVGKMRIKLFGAGYFLSNRQCILKHNIYFAMKDLVI